ncbi:MAG: hypothetical protein M5U16_11540 [Hyphomicrobium sp.]|nr:hypothetical protein [Hyphomicrobium sp.]
MSVLTFQNQPISTASAPCAARDVDLAAVAAAQEGAGIHAGDGAVDARLRNDPVET